MCGRSVEEKRKKAELKKKRQEKLKKETEQPRSTRRKSPKRNTPITSGTGGTAKPYAVSPLDMTQKTASSDPAKSRLPFDYLSPIQSRKTQSALIVEEDLCRCKDYAPDLLDLQYLFDLLNEN